MKKNFIKERKQSRGQQEWYLLNFLRNLARAAKLMHACLRQMNTDKMMIDEAKRNYIIAMTSSLETFYHDLFIYVLEKDRSLLEDILGDIKDKPTFAEIHTLLKDGVSFPEIAASMVKFQSIEELDRSLSKLFPPQGYLKTLDTYEHICAIPSRTSDLVIMTMPEDWGKDFSDLFKNRHAFVHDANLACDIAGRQMAKLETLVLQIAQFTSGLITKRYYGEALLTEKGVPAFLIIEDLISDDWEVVEDE